MESFIKTEAVNFGGVSYCRILISMAILSNPVLNSQNFHAIPYIFFNHWGEELK